VNTTDDGFSNDCLNPPPLTEATGRRCGYPPHRNGRPQVGKDLREKALFAMFYALLFITIYISGRFELKWLLSGVMAAALMTAVYLFCR
jgi:preprotein translocase subunit SecF